MAGGEDEPQQIVADVVVERGVERRRVGTSRLRASISWPSSLVLALEQLAAAQAVDARDSSRSPSATRRGCRARRCRPLLERGDQRVLRQLLGHADVAHHAREAGDRACADSMRQTASIARWVSVAVTAADQPSRGLIAQDVRRNQAACAAESPLLNSGS